MNDRKAGSSLHPIRGIIPPIVTPLLGRDELDVAGLEKLLEHQLAGGVHGIFVLGSTGETASLSQTLRRELVTQTCRIVAGRVPVLVGVTDTVFVDSINMARHAASAGAQMIVSTSPFYFLISQAELRKYFEQLLAESPLPLLLYNIPKLTKVPLETDTVRALMDSPRIVGIKDSSGEGEYLRQLLAMASKRADWSVLVGMETQLAECIRAGGHGGIVGGANFNPRPYVALYEAALRGDAAAEAASLKILSAQSDIHRIGTFVSDGIKGIKAALSQMGICGDRTAEPLFAATDEQRKRIGELLKQAGLLR
jgi:4-hydroxy-tetrahydrodipicolinate synthase